MTRTAVRTDVFETTDVCGNLTLQVTFNRERFYLFTDRVFLFGCKLWGFGVLVDAELLKDALGPRKPNAVHSGKTVREMLVVWNVDTYNSHIDIRLALALLMTRLLLVDDEDNAAALYDLIVGTNFFD